ncbi:hypothetical protein AB0L00_44525 [Actinoallomurus sp. NPDC052308]|uniref:hypothetical protein n=1 Tax=Actinoallomurus sp. NPDC052308 TaxID=3155530 RepID=UPI00343D4C2F
MTSSPSRRAFLAATATAAGAAALPLTATGAAAAPLAHRGNRYRKMKAKGIR